MGSARDALQLMLAAERDISQELETLAALKIFPAPELFLIRKETKHFRETQGRTLADQGSGVATSTEEAGREGSVSQPGPGDASLEAELALVDRKLAILRARRHDAEEARAASRRKNAKLKQLQQTQSRDPSNFGNQSHY